jgi:hypothetical protein|tara:strand:- start:120 stop:341 length:222 start_codon:yes stop_codon:yes gene_type:complete
MSCNLRQKMLDALVADAQGNIAKAKANIEVYLHNPVGIGEHPDVLAAIQEQLDIIAHEDERIEVIQNHFSEHE